MSNINSNNKDEGLCSCVRHVDPNEDRTDGLLNIGSCISWPEYVRTSIFLCGYKDTYFPFHCMVGPDWLTALFTSFGIIIPTIIFLIFVSENISPYMTLADGILGAITIVSHWITVFSDPGVVFVTDTNLYSPTTKQIMIPVDVESPNVELNNLTANKISPLQVPTGDSMDCHRCAIVRKNTARHCYTCDACIDGLDHHCPFMGKCIGKKNMWSFKIFLYTIGIHTYFVIGTTGYYIIARVIIPAAKGE